MSRRRAAPRSPSSARGGRATASVMRLTAATRTGVGTRLRRGGLIVGVLVVFSPLVMASAGNAGPGAGQEMQGRPGVIVFIGSGPIDQGPSRPGVQAAAPAARANFDAREVGQTDARVPPPASLSRRTASLARRGTTGRPPGTSLPVGSGGSELLQELRRAHPPRGDTHGKLLCDGAARPGPVRRRGLRP